MNNYFNKRASLKVSSWSNYDAHEKLVKKSLKNVFYVILSVRKRSDKILNIE